MHAIILQYYSKSYLSSGVEHQLQTDVRATAVKTHLDLQQCYVGLNILFIYYAMLEQSSQLTYLMLSVHCSTIMIKLNT